MEFRFLMKILKYWKYLIILFYILICLYIFNLSRKVSYQQVSPSSLSKVLFSLSFCYQLAIREEQCKPSYNYAIDKLDFPDNCSFTRPIECYTKGFRDLKIGEILKKIEKCNIDKFIKIDKKSKISLKLYFGHICVNHEIAINFLNESNQKKWINIYPQQKDQIFLITIASKREYENEKPFKSPIVNIFRRYCWTEPFPPSLQNETKYYCSEDGRKIIFKLDYFSVKSLTAPYESDCVYREEGDTSTQAKCFESCVKNEKPHSFMTYINSSYDSKLTFENASVMQPLTNRCLNKCSKIDCNYGSFDVANIKNIDDIKTKMNKSNDSIALEIPHTDHRTEVIPLMPKTILIYYLIVFIYLFFGFNLYENLFKKFCLKSYFNHLKLEKKRQKKNCKLLIFSLVSLVFGLAVGTLSEWQLFDFGREDKVVVIKRESTLEINVSTSICFDLLSILKDPNSNYTEADLFKLKDLNELNELTWSVRDFKKVSSMRNSVGPVPIRHDEKDIYVFYRDFKKCFLIYYETKQLFPHIYLQRKSHIFFNTTAFSHFYVEQNFKYPQLNSHKIKKSTLFTLRQNGLNGYNCKRYDEKTENCLCKDDCIQDCVIKKYLHKSTIPTFVNLKEKYFAKYGNFRFINDSQEFKQVLNECKSYFPEIECNSANITLRPKYIVKDEHNISINLTPNTIVLKELDDEDKLVVFNRILGFLIILTGFSVRELFDDLILFLYNTRLSSRITTLLTFINYRFAKRLTNFLVFLMFVIHFIFLYSHIINHEMLQISYKNFLTEISLPKLRICYETGIDLNYNNYSKLDLDARTLKIEDFFIGLNYLDEDFNSVFKKIEETDNEIFATQSFYLDNLKCFSILIKKRMQVSNANILLIDQLITVFVNLEKIDLKRFLVYLNVENTIDLEWSTFLYNATFYNLYYSTKQFFYNDDYYYLKNFKSLLKSLLKLAEKNTQKNYFSYLTKAYNEEQNVATTIVPLEADNHLTINNEQFDAFIHFRSIDGNKNYWDFTHNSEIPRFSYDLYKESPEKRNESIANKSIVALRPTISSCLKNKIKNKYHIIEFIIHLLILTSFWLKFDLATLPSSLKNAFPVFKFFINLFIYVIVVLLIFIFDIGFKFFGFFK